MDGAQDNAATGTWFDWMTPSALMAGEGGPEVLLAQFVAVVLVVPNAMFGIQYYGTSPIQYYGTSPI